MFVRIETTPAGTILQKIVPTREQSSYEDEKLMDLNELRQAIRLGFVREFRNLTYEQSIAEAEYWTIREHIQTDRKWRE